MVKKKTVTREDKIKDYKASDIQALTPLQHLRRRLNLTFGDERGCDEYPFSSQQNVAVREIWDNALGEIAIGVANRLRVTFYRDGVVKIEDNGRGIPTDISEDAYGNKVSGIFKALGLLQSGSALKGVQKGKFTTSQNGVGGSSTNGVSEWFKVRVFKNKKIYALDFLDYVPGLFDDNGVFKPAKDNSEIFTLKDNRSKEDKELFAHGSSVEFKLNDKWFIVPYPFDKEDIIARIRGAAYLYPHTTMEVLDEQEDGSFDKQIFNSEEGIKELVDIQVGNNITKIIDFNGATAFREKGQGHNNPNIPKGATGETLLEYINKEYGDGDLLNDERELYYNLAFNYNSGYDCIIDTYCNDIRTTLGGVHVQALEKALTDAFNTKFRSMKNGLNKNDSDVIVKDVEEGLTAVLSIKTNVPRFVGQEKQLLGGKELQKALYDSIYSQLTEWLNKGSNRDDVEIIAKKVITAMKNRTRIQEQQELNREKNKVMRDSSMPVKLVDCEITHAPISEILVCLKGDTKIKLLNGTDVAIESLIGKEDFWAYSSDLNGKMVPAKISSVFKTQEVNRLLKITLSDGSYVECTPEHKFLDRITGEWVEAKTLVAGQSLYSIKTRIGTSINMVGRPEIWIPGHYTKSTSKTRRKQGKWIPLHRYVKSFFEKLKPGYDVHHEDLNVLNNEPENLLQVTKKEHLAIHNRINHDSGIMKYENKHFTEESRYRMQYASHFRTEEGVERQKEAARKSWENNRHNLNRTWAKYNINERYDEHGRDKTLVAKYLKCVKVFLNNKIEVTSESWKKYKQELLYPSAPNFQKIIDMFGSIDTAIEEAKNYNLSVVSIEEINYETAIPVYCLNVENEYHSFVLENGLVTHNCEGDSALGGLKAIRDSRYQALFPIRGKILNVLKASPKDIMQNQETQDIIKCLDCGLGEDFDIEKMRYHNVVIAADADVDGSAISNLLITWFWVLMPEVIKQGRLFRMLSPLYEIIVSKDEFYYCVNSQEKEDIENKLKKENKEIKKINRFKGLGETDPDVLFEVGMNPETRRIAQITIEDVEKAEEIINLISGDDADARKEWIMANPYTPEVVEFNEEVE